MNKLYIKTVAELTDNEIMEINAASQREFHTTFEQALIEKSRLIFLLKNTKGYILSVGQLIKIEPVRFMGHIFSILGIGGIIASVKGKGYGKKLMTGIKQYLKRNKKIGIGFCGKVNKGFYEKCLFGVDQNITKRFIYKQKNGKKIYPRWEETIYFDPIGNLFPKIFENLTDEVVLFRPPDW